MVFYSKDVSSTELFFFLLFLWLDYSKRTIWRFSWLQNENFEMWLFSQIFELCRKFQSKLVPFKKLLCMKCILRIKKVHKKQHSELMLCAIAVFQLKNISSWTLIFFLLFLWLVYSKLTIWGIRWLQNENFEMWLFSHIRFLNYSVSFEQSHTIF